ncbi:YkoP family protein [Polycladomyces subterraneus]|uniref:YkoP-like domain-containing protein n=1 Tax=Polycladomyces subterraneus TaxID=1016997 RepID=A0ABT8IQ10_9BACL|nr:hypothetical protein [Polycladomyces subterraneus]MDN4594879.1 hypothetical protein [Polycladomyces subterraneus]
MSGGLLSAWRMWDQLYYHCTRLQYVDRENQNLFRVVIKPYHGPTLTTSDGVVLHRGDWYAKLHLHNCLLAHILRRYRGDDVQMALRVLTEVRQSLPALARFVADHPRSGQIRVLMGTTFLHRGSQHLGFDVTDLPDTWYAAYKTWFFKFILSNCHPEGWKRLKTGNSPLVPKRVYISKARLFRRYLDGEEP